MTTFTRKILGLILAATAVVILGGVTVSADMVGGLYITADDGGVLTSNDYSINGDNLNILSDRPMTLKNVTPEPIETRIDASNASNVNLTLDGVNIVNICAFYIYDNCYRNVTITLADGSENTLVSTNHGNNAGIRKNGISDSVGKLTIKGGPLGTGRLNVTGAEYAAGIGGSNQNGTRNIEISGGIVNATGGTAMFSAGGAGIGGGHSGKGSNIVISGGTVTATGATGGAGIGGGTGGTGSDIYISGGNVIANGGGAGAGIGGGWNNGSNIVISGGNVIANGGIDSSGIGGGLYGTGSDIYISGGNVIANGGIGSTDMGGAGIGGGKNGTGSNIVISGGSVKAKGDENVPDISEAPTDGKGNKVYPTTLETGVTQSASVALNGGEKKTYVMHPEETKLYFWLPVGKATAVYDGAGYEADVKETGTNVFEKLFEMGDLNGDGRITVSDIVMMKRVIASGKPDDITGCNAAAADVDGNGAYTVADILEIKRLIANAG